MTSAPSHEESMLHWQLFALREQRNAAQAYMDHRFNCSITPTRSHPQVCLSTLRLGSYPNSTIICYPLRISNVCIEGTPQIILRNLLLMAQHEGWGEILIITVQMELDETVSVDVGFRFVEDAIVMWSRHGKSHCGRSWHITPTEKVVQRKCAITRSPATNPLPLQSRLDRLLLCEALERRLCEPHVPSRQLDQLRSVITQLSPDALSMNALSIETVIKGWEDHHLNGHDRVELNSLPEPAAFGQAWFWGVDCQPSNWTMGDLSISLKNSFPFQMTPLEVSRKAPTTTSIKHARRREKAQARPQPNMNDPASGRSMIAVEWVTAERSTRHLAKLKHDAWNDFFQFPQLPLKLASTQDDLAEHLMPVWQWYDECLQVIIDYGISSGLASLQDKSLSEADKVRLDSFHAARLAFGPEKRLKMVFGPDYSKMMEKVALLSIGYNTGKYIFTRFDPAY